MTQIESGTDPRADAGAGDDPGNVAMLSVERIGRIGEGAILYDASLADQPLERWFDPDGWPVATPAQAGRGATVFIADAEHDWVLRHYRRGGAVARLATDEFVWAGEARTRSFAEWRVLDRLRRAGLPVPRPVAARYLRRGLIYRADLITERLPHVQSLAARLAAGPIPLDLWRRIGACLGRFERAGACHADLNAHNIQIDAAGAIHLLDFDRGRLREPGGGWCGRNRARLHRSLLKVTRNHREAFTADDWAALRSGIREDVPADARANRSGSQRA